MISGIERQTKFEIRKLSAILDEAEKEEECAYVTLVCSLSLKNGSKHNIRRLNYAFIQQPGVSYTWFTKRRHSHIRGGRGNREWYEDYRPRHVLNVSPFDWRVESIGLDSESDAKDQIMVVGAEEAELNWRKVYAGMYAGWQEPTIASIAASALLNSNRLP